jgi:type IV secretion system protein VirD4
MDTPLILGRGIDNGRLLDFTSDEHVIVHARSGAGKTAGFAIPNAFEWPGSMVCLDVKRELFEASAGFRHAQGHKVILFDPSAEDGRTHRWSPFHTVDRESPERFWQVAKIANQIFPEIQDSGRGSDDYWSGAAREGFITGALLIAETPEEPLTMARVLRLFRRGGSGDWMIHKVEARRDAGRPYSQAVADGVSAWAAVEKDRIGLSIKSAITTKLQIFASPRIAAATNATDFDLRDLRRQRMTIYVGVAPGDIEAMAPLLRIFFDAVLNQNTTKTPYQDPKLNIPVLMLLDEFARLGKMQRVVDSLQYARGYGIRYALIMQNRAQLMATYGSQKATDVFDNAGAELVLGTGDQVLAKQIEERLGDATINVVTHTRPRFFPFFNVDRQTNAEHPHRRPVMLAAEIMQMPSYQMLVLRPGMPGALLQKVQWFRDPAYIDKQKPPPEIPQLSIVVQMDDGGPLQRQPQLPPAIAQSEMQ